MAFAQQQQPVLMGTKKRRHMTQELLGRFESKKDFLKYFTESCKCYLTPLYCLRSATLRATGQDGQQRLP